MRFVGRIIKSAVIFALALVLFGLDPPIAWDSPWAGLFLNVVFYVLASTIIGILPMAASLLIAGVGASLVGKGHVKLGFVLGCGGIIMILVVAFCVNFAVLMNAPQFISFFPEFTKGQAAAIVIVDMLTNLLFFRPAKKSKEEE